MESAANARQLLYCNLLLSVFSDQSDLVALLRLRDIRRIHHQLVHTDTAQDSGAAAADQDIRPA